MIDYCSDKSKCTACGACAEACPNKAITIKEDEYGFLFPKVNTALCIKCGSCDNICHIKNSPEKHLPKHSFIYENDLEVLKKSSSGGAFSAISDIILNDGGIVFGTKLDENINAVVTEATDKAGRDLMRGSVYCQSKNTGSFEKIKKYLENGKKVMFIGTPCQVAGLYNYLGDKTDTEHLLSVDFICHGVSSNKLLRSHIQYLEKKHKKHIVKYNFRDKKYIWSSHGIEEAVCDDGKTIADKDTQLFRLFFHDNLSLRESCYTCPYRDGGVADITIADFWGIKKIDGKNHDLGVSLILSNTEKGASYINKIKSGKLTEIPFELIKPKTSRKKYSMPSGRKEFFDTYSEKGYDALVIKYRKRIRSLRFLLKKIIQRNYTVR